MNLMATVSIRNSGATGMIIGFPAPGMALVDIDVAPGRLPAYTTVPVSQLLPFTPDNDI